VEGFGKPITFFVVYKVKIHANHLISKSGLFLLKNPIFGIILEILFICNVYEETKPDTPKNIYKKI
jgi:hypothetical protein